jgi:hypothetical protein
MPTKAKSGISGKVIHVSRPKRSRQGRSPNTSLSATSRNGRRKAYRGQGS